MASKPSKKKLSKLERSLSKNLKTDSDEQLLQVRELLVQMAEKPSKQVVITSYPSCNSVI